MKDFQRIFTLAQTYVEPAAIDQCRWQWPEGWLTKRRRELAVKQMEDKQDDNP